MCVGTVFGCKIVGHSQNEIFIFVCKLVRASAAAFASFERGQQCFWRSVIPESRADVDESVDVSGTKYKTAAELQRVFAQFVLPVSCCLGPFAGAEIERIEKMQQGSLAQLKGFVCLPILIDEKRKSDSGFFAEKPGVIHVSEPHGGKAGFLFAKLLFMRAQLRDVLATEDSAIMAQKNQHSRTICPQRTQAHSCSIDAGQGYVCKLAAERFRHGGTFS